MVGYSALTSLPKVCQQFYSYLLADGVTLGGKKKDKFQKSFKLIEQYKKEYRFDYISDRGLKIQAKPNEPERIKLYLSYTFGRIG